MAPRCVPEHSRTAHGPQRILVPDLGFIGHAVEGPRPETRSGHEQPLLGKENTMNKEKGEHAAPLGSAKSGRLEFVRGAANVTLHVGSGMEDLYRARFDGPVPDVGAEGGAVTVKYTWTLHPFDWRRRGADIALNAQVPWRITVRGGGVSRLDADLGGLRLDSFEVEGGASRVELTLPDPSGAVPIRIDGGASNVTVRRPEGVAARVDVGGRGEQVGARRPTPRRHRRRDEAGEPGLRRRHGPVRDHHHRRRQQRGGRHPMNVGWPAEEDSD